MYMIGIDIGGTFVKAGIVDKDGNIVTKSSIKTPLDPPVLAQNVAAQVKALVTSAGLTDADFTAVGVGCPGMIDSKKGVVEYSNNLRWTNVPLGEILSEALGHPVSVLNDANAAALGEFSYGAGRQYDSMIMVTLGTGVGGGIIIDGKLFEGAGMGGTELGHMVVRFNGEPCSCGRNGCLEAYASATALIRNTKAAMEADKGSSMWAYAGDLAGVNGKTAFECAKTGDKTAQKVVDEYVNALGEGLCNFVNIFRPEAIVLGGGVSAQGDYLLRPLDKFNETFGYGGKKSSKVVLTTASLGNDAGLIGAAYFAVTGQS